MEQLMAGTMHHDVPVDEVQQEDWVEYYEDGQRIARVTEKHEGRKHKYLLLDAHGKRLKFQIGDPRIRRVWRRGHEGTPTMNPPECFLKVTPNRECYDDKGDPCLFMDRCSKGDT